MATSTAPGIQWYSYTIANSVDTTATQTLITENTIDFDAVQAGNYSNVICVRPKFADQTESTQTIGNVRFWWSDFQANVTGDVTNYSLPASGWIMKYYVSNCLAASDSSLTGSAKTTKQLENVAKMIKFFATQKGLAAKSFGDSGGNVSSTTYNVNTISGNGTSDYFKSVWQASSDQNKICMQPIPFFNGNKFGNSLAQVTNFDTNYSSQSWKSIIFNNNSTDNNEKSKLLYYSVGGQLNNNGSGCNIATCVSADGDYDFPFIFITIYPQSNATAGTWSGFSCRMSFIWPFSKPTNN